MPLYQFFVENRECQRGYKFHWAPSHSKALAEMRVIWPSLSVLVTLDQLEVPETFWENAQGYAQIAGAWKGFSALIFGSANLGWALARYSHAKDKLVMPNFSQNQFKPLPYFYSEGWGEFILRNHCAYDCAPMAQPRRGVPELKVYCL